MERVIAETKKRFIATILLVVVCVVAISWGILSVYNQREIDQPAHASDVHASGADNAALAAYLEEQKAYEAHFVTIASDVKSQDAARLTKGLAVSTVIVVVIGTVIAIFAARRLMRPVVSAYESQERFVQDAAHELRNPLAAMTVALQQADPTKNDPQLLKMFRRQTKRLININEDLLFLEKSSHQPPTQLNISELLSDVIEELQPLAKSKHVVIRLKTDPGIIKTMVSADYVRLAKNIIDNAIKYTRPNTAVTVTQHKIKNTIVLTVKDQGIGIPKDDLPHIGERFFRAQNTGKIDGTGLGLAIVRKILHSNGGKFALESSPKGTTVSVSLPA